VCRSHVYTVPSRICNVSTNHVYITYTSISLSDLTEQLIILLYFKSLPGRLNYCNSFYNRRKGYGSRGPGFDSRRYQIFWEVMGLDRGPLSRVSTSEEILGRNSRGSGLETRQYGRRDTSHWRRGTLYPNKKLALTSPTSGGLSWTQATEFSFNLGNETAAARPNTIQQGFSKVVIPGYLIGTHNIFLGQWKVQPCTLVRSYQTAW
jgi:hypothetical protein